MNSFELNKILGAVLATCLVLLALSIGAGALFAPEKPAKPGYAIAVKEGGAAGKPAAAEPEKPIAVLLASASAEKGQATAKQCQACHTFEKGGPNRVGPNLWNIVGDERGKDRGGFNFSAAMKAKGGEWSYEELNKFLIRSKQTPGAASRWVRSNINIRWENVQGSSRRRGARPVRHKGDAQMTSTRKMFLLVLAVAVLSLFAVSHAAAEKTEITYMAWYNTTQSEAARTSRQPSTSSTPCRTRSTSR